MQAIAISAPGGPEVLVSVQRPVPQPQAGEMRIRVAASGINRPDVLQRKGAYPPPPGASDLPGLEVAGWVDAGDPQELAAAGFALGAPVCALLSGGGYAQYALAPLGQCLPVPEGLSLVQAASLPETWFTVWSNLIDRAGLKPGERLLVHGGTSGIGSTAIELARAMGVWVAVTAGSAAKCQTCLALGADAAIDYNQQDFVAEIHRLTAGAGVDVILDMVAGDYLGRDLKALADDGRVVVIAVQGGVRAQVDAGQILRRRLTVTGSTLRPRSVAFKARIAQALQQTVWPWLAQGRVKPLVHATWPAQQASAAHALMESGAHVGKIVLTWSD